MSIISKEQSLYPPPTPVIDIESLTKGELVKNFSKTRLVEKIKSFVAQCFKGERALQDMTSCHTVCSSKKSLEGSFDDDMVKVRSFYQLQPIRILQDNRPPDRERLYALIACIAITGMVIYSSIERKF